MARTQNNLPRKYLAYISYMSMYTDGHCFCLLTTCYSRLRISIFFIWNSSSYLRAAFRDFGLLLGQTETTTISVYRKFEVVRKINGEMDKLYVAISLKPWQFGENMLKMYTHFQHTSGILTLQGNGNPKLNSRLFNEKLIRYKQGYVIKGLSR